jgi:endoglucanase
VDPGSNAMTQAKKWQNSRKREAEIMRVIAEQPMANWFNGWQKDVRKAADQLMDAAAKSGSVATLVAYNIPQRDCGSYSAGGSNNADAYKKWIRNFADGIGNRRAIVILEPDALAGMSCLSPTDRKRRTDLIADAVEVLKSRTQAIVYIDGGHSNWIGASEMAQRLKDANIANADGFALNVSNFHTTSANTSYGSKVSGLVGGKHFVIDTSRNGSGTNNGEWCNPKGRSLGQAPTTKTGHALVDAYLWIKRPGESDGSCNGGPRSGQWWPEYAIDLAQRSPVQLFASLN